MNFNNFLCKLLCLLSATFVSPERLMCAEISLEVNKAYRQILHSPFLPKDITEEDEKSLDILKKHINETAKLLIREYSKGGLARKKLFIVFEVLAQQTRLQIARSVLSSYPESDKPPFPFLHYLAKEGKKDDMPRLKKIIRRYPDGIGVGIAISISVSRNGHGQDMLRELAKELTGKWQKNPTVKKMLLGRQILQNPKGNNETIVLSRLQDAIRIFNSTPDNIREAYTPVRWDSLEQLFNKGKLIAVPKTFPQKVDNARHKIHNGTGGGEKGVASKETPFYPAVWTLRSVEWHKIGDGYFIVKGFPPVGPSIPQLVFFHKGPHDVWREIVWLEDKSKLWNVGLDDYNNMDGKGREDLHMIGEPMKLLRSDLLSLTLHLLKKNRTTSGHLDWQGLGAGKLSSYLTRLFHWGVYSERSPYGIKTNSAVLNQILKKVQNNYECEWSQVRKHFYVLRLQRLSRQESPQLSGYAILEKQRNGTYLCHFHWLWEFAESHSVDAKPKDNKLKDNKPKVRPDRKR